MLEPQKDMEAKEKRLIELDRLIKETDETIAHMELTDGPMTAESRRTARRWLIQEREWYRRGHPFAEWPKFMTEIQARERQSAIEAAARAKSEAESKAEAEKAAAEREAQEREEWEKENDPFLLWKRSRAARTF